MPPQLENFVPRLPHGPEFRFLTRVLELRPGASALAEWSVDGSESFFRAHFPGRPVVPGVLLGEALAQLSGLVAFAADGPPTPARLAHMDLRFNHAVEPPATIALRSALTRRFGSLVQCDVEASASGQRVACGTVTLAAPSDAPPGKERAR